MAITFINPNSTSSIWSLAIAVVYSLILQTAWVTWRTLVTATLSKAATSLNWAAMAVKMEKRCRSSRHWARPRTNRSGQLFRNRFVRLEVLNRWIRDSVAHFVLTLNCWTLAAPLPSEWSGREGGKQLHKWSVCWDTLVMLILVSQILPAPS